jgi:GT2 family glycosyltransferase
MLADVPCVRSLAELPEPPAGRIGWPWTEQPSLLRSTAPGGRPWPRLTIITPSYNQADFLEATIRSVLLQGYPGLEYVVIDGGSSDRSVEIISRYTDWLTFWVSEPDRGQSHAINKGLARCGGEVFNWINSDDLLAPGALGALGALRATTRASLLVGRGIVIDTGSGAIRHDWHPRPPSRPLDFTRSGEVRMAQASTFLETRLVRELGGLREDLHYVLDWELYLRVAVHLRGALTTATTPALLSYAAYHPGSKTSRDPAGFQAEGLRVLRGLGQQLPAIERLRLAMYIRAVVTQQLVGHAWSTSDRGRYLAGLLVRRPDALYSRPYWGAVRRVLLGTGGAG